MSLIKKKEPNIPDLIQTTIPNTIIDGTTNNREFIKDKLIDKGGFSYVYKLKDNITNEIFACKVLDHTKRWKETMNEIKIHKSLSHTNIIKVINVLPIDNYNLLIMDYCHNKSLFHYLNRKKRINKCPFISEKRSKHFFKQSTCGLNYIHNKRIIHNDIKLGNLFLTRNSEIKIGDFGLSTQFYSIIDKSDIDYKICGTPNFASPENVEQSDKGKNKGHSYPSDIWALGACLYNMLFGIAPFETKEKSKKITFKRISDVYYIFPDKPCISENAKSIIESILQKDPLDRIDICDILIHPFLNDDSF